MITKTIEKTNTKHEIQIQLHRDDPLQPLKIYSPARPGTVINGDELRIRRRDDITFICQDPFSIFFPDDEIVEPGDSAFEPQAPETGGIVFNCLPAKRDGSFIPPFDVKVKVAAPPDPDSDTVGSSFEYYITVIDREGNADRVYTQDPDIYVEDC